MRMIIFLRALAVLLFLFSQGFWNASLAPVYAQSAAIENPGSGDSTCTVVQPIGKCAVLRPFANVEYQAGAVLYMQKAGEYRALAYQAFNIARRMLDLDFSKKLSKADRKMPRAVIVDVDETVLDNSPLQAYSLKRHMSYNPTAFTEWAKLEQAAAIPGAVDFLSYAAKKGVKVFYVTSRNMDEQKPTIDNLKLLGFPDPSVETVLVRTDTSSKEPRRQLIARKYRIVLLIGDNLNDFAQAFEGKNIEMRFAEVDKARTRFGESFIMLPNAIYGAWEDAIYEYDRTLTDSQKVEKRDAALQDIKFSTDSQ